jgi:hypothetical protein
MADGIPQFLSPTISQLTSPTSAYSTGIFQHNLLHTNQLMRKRTAPVLGAMGVALS